MQLDQLTKVGQLTQAKNLKGEIKAAFEVSFFNYLEENDPTHLYVLIGGKPLPYFVEAIYSNAHQTTVKFEGVDNRSQAESLQRKELYIETEKIVPYLDDSDEGWDYLLGYTVIVKNDNSPPLILGTIEGIVYLTEHELAQVFYEQKEILLPLNEVFIVEIEEDKQQIYFELPEGLLEIYLNPQADDPDDIDRDDE